MENFQEKIRENVYEECFIIYKRCLKINLHDGKNLKIKLLKDKINENLNKDFFVKLSNRINSYLLINDKYLIKILDNHFKNNTFKSLEGNYIIKNKNITKENLDKYINKIKFKTLNLFYEDLKLEDLENNIFNHLRFNVFIFYLKKNMKKFFEPLGYLILLSIIFYFSDNFNKNKFNKFNKNN